MEKSCRIEKVCSTTNKSFIDRYQTQVEKLNPLTTEEMDTQKKTYVSDLQLELWKYHTTAKEKYKLWFEYFSNENRYVSAVTLKFSFV